MRTWRDSRAASRSDSDWRSTRSRSRRERRSKRPAATRVKSQAAGSVRDRRGEIGRGRTGDGHLPVTPEHPDRRRGDVLVRRHRPAQRLAAFGDADGLRRLELSLDRATRSVPETLVASTPAMSPPPGCATGSKTAAPGSSGREGRAGALSRGVPERMRRAGRRRALGSESRSDRGCPLRIGLSGYTRVTARKSRPVLGQRGEVAAASDLGDRPAQRSLERLPVSRP